MTYSVYSINVDNTINLNTGSTYSGFGTQQAGEFRWDDGEGVATVGLKGGNTILDIGAENVILAYNDTASTMTKGQLVYISGAQGNRPAIKLASANAESTQTVIGMVSETILAGAEGFITTFGMVHKLNTIGLTAGVPIWLGSTPGTYQQAPLDVPYHSNLVGYVVRIHASVGSIFINPHVGYELAELHDVKSYVTSSIPDKAYLGWSASGGYWEAMPFTGGGGGGSQTLEQTLALGNNVGAYSIDGTSNLSLKQGQYLTNPGGTTYSLPQDISLGNNYIQLRVGGQWNNGGSEAPSYLTVSTHSISLYAGQGVGSVDGPGNIELVGNTIISVTSSVLATDSTGKIIATSSASGTSGTSGINGSSGTSGVNGSSGSSGTSGTSAFTSLGTASQTSITNPVVRTYSGTIAVDTGIDISPSYRSSSANLRPVTLTTGDITVSGQDGDYGPRIYFGPPQTGTTLSGMIIDMYQDKVRFYDSGINAKGFYLDLTSGSNNAGTNLLSGGSGTSGTSGVSGTSGSSGSSGTSGANGITPLYPFFTSDTLSTNKITGQTLQVNSSATTTVAGMGINYLRVVPYTPLIKTGTVTEISFSVTSGASGNAKIVVYTDLSGVPNKLIASSSDISTTTSGVKKFTTSIGMTAGTTYWIGLMTSASPTIVVSAAASMTPLSINLLSTGSQIFNHWGTQTATYSGGALTDFSSYGNLNLFAGTPPTFSIYY